MGAERVTAQKNSKGLQNLTVFGAVGACLQRPVFHIFKTTNTDCFAKFIGELGEKTSGIRGLHGKPFLVLDKHPAHKSVKGAREMEKWFQPLFQPAQSSPFNCQKTVWSMLKRNFYNQLHQREHHLYSLDQFSKFLQDSLDLHERSINTGRIMNANKRYVEGHSKL